MYYLVRNVALDPDKSESDLKKYEAQQAMY